MLSLLLLVLAAFLGEQGSLVGRIFCVFNKLFTFYLSLSLSLSLSPSTSLRLHDPLLIPLSRPLPDNKHITLLSPHSPLPHTI